MLLCYNKRHEYFSYVKLLFYIQFKILYLCMATSYSWKIVYYLDLLFNKVAIAVNILFRFKLPLILF